MSSTVGALHGIAAPSDRWDDVGRGRLSACSTASSTARTCSAPTARSRTSAAATRRPRRRVADHAGREVRVLWVKGSGTDLATITAAGFPGLRLDELLPLREREADGRRGDGRLPAAQRACGPTSRGRRSRRCCTPSCPPTHVDHTHPDAVIALTSTPDGRRLAEEAFGDEAVWLDYQRPGFDMSRRIAAAARGATRRRAPCCSRSTGSSPGARRRGELRGDDRVRHARRPRDRRGGAGRFGLGGQKVAELGEGSARSPPVAVPARAPRRTARATPTALVLEVDRSPEAVAFASSVRAPEVSQIGAPCPDHLINTKHKPLVVDVRPGDGRRRRARARRSGRGVAEYAGLVPRLLRAQPRRRDAAVPDRSGRARASCSCPGVGIVTTRLRRGPRARSRATSTTARSPSRTRPTRSAASAR